MAEVHDIFTRAHTVVSEQRRREHKALAKWPDEVLVIDTETTLDTTQRLNFGVYRLCRLGTSEYLTVEEGLFYTDDLDAMQLDVLKRFVEDTKNLPRVEVKRFPPPIRLNLLNRSAFVERVFWKAIRNGAMIVGFILRVRGNLARWDHM